MMSPPFGNPNEISNFISKQIEYNEDNFEFEDDINRYNNNDKLNIV